MSKESRANGSRSNQKKLPKAAFSPSPSKQPVSRWPTTNQSNDRVAWRFGDMEFEGEWGWHKASAGQLHEARHWLAQMEKLTWGEACGPRAGAKLVKIADAPSKAMQRLEELEKDDLDLLVEFHPQGKPRIWGARRGNVCHLLWWDPDHTVWPSRRK